MKRLPPRLTRKRRRVCGGKEKGGERLRGGCAKVWHAAVGTHQHTYTHAHTYLHTHNTHTYNTQDSHTHMRAHTNNTYRQTIPKNHTHGRTHTYTHAATGTTAYTHAQLHTDTTRHRFSCVSFASDEVHRLRLSVTCCAASAVNCFILSHTHHVSQAPRLKPPLAGVHTHTPRQTNTITTFFLFLLQTHEHIHAPFTHIHMHATHTHAS